MTQFGIEYQTFLFTSLGDDRNGVPLIVASLLGRMNLDPWLEAASLAALPAEIAGQKLASLIEAIPGQLLKPSESAALAARLIMLLPSRSELEPRRSALMFGNAASISRKTVLRIIWFVALWILLVLGVRLATASGSL